MFTCFGDESWVGNIPLRINFLRAYHISNTKRKGGRDEFFYWSNSGLELSLDEISLWLWASYVDDLLSIIQGTTLSLERDCWNLCLGKMVYIILHLFMMFFFRLILFIIPHIFLWITTWLQFGAFRLS